MTRLFKITFTTIASMTLLGCANDVMFMSPNDSNQQEQLSSNSCDGLAMQKVEVSQVEIEGAKVGSKGQRLDYNLSKVNGCAPDMDVAWKTVGADKSKAIDSRFQPMFKKAGSYVIAADVSGNNEFRKLAYQTIILGDEPVLVAPQVAEVDSPVTFSLALPAGHNIEWVSWNFGNGPSMVNSTDPVSHTFLQPGEYEIEVIVDPLQETKTVILHTITIVEKLPGTECLDQLAVSGASEATVGEELALSLYIPECLISEVSAIRWNFGDGSQTSGNQNVTHTYSEIGDYTAKVDVFLPHSTEPWVSLNHNISVTEPEKEEEDNGGFPIDPIDDDEANICRALGEGREFFTDIYTETADCGTSGSKTLSYRDEVYEECEVQDGAAVWIEISRDKRLLDEGSCEGQACVLPDGSSLADGESKTHYMTQTPEASCASVSETRQCLNGELQGSSNFQYLTCQDGCSGFGSHGEVRTEVVTGTIAVPLQCQFGEQGFTSVYTELSDKRCDSGSVVTFNTRRGSLESEDQCPTYDWAPTKNWTQCSADCGGEQSRVYVCKSNQGTVSQKERCTESQVQETRVCDANPDAVRREEVKVTPEEVKSTNCPADQIGTIVKRREVTTTETYACIGHQVQLESSAVTSTTGWETEQYCRTLRLHRCSHDSLSIEQGLGRLAWIDKCQDHSPVLKEYWKTFEGRELIGVRDYYPTFGNSYYTPDKLWRAPTSADASCYVPNTVYVAAVCASSCATPEQQILINEGGEFSYTSFIEAHTSNQPFAATLPEGSSMSTAVVQSTAVANWVTELFDTEHNIVEFTMASGRTLRVTDNHPVLTKDGTMKHAEFFEVGEHLVEVGGKLDEIVALDKQKYFGKVYNLFVKSAVPEENIVVTNGYLNGTAFYQNEGVDQMDRVILRTRLTSGAFDE